MLELASLDLISNIKTFQIIFLLSEETLAEIRRLDTTKAKGKDLEALYFHLKAGRSVIRNSSVTFDDPIATMDSLDVFMDHPYDDTDLNKVKAFLTSKGNTDEMDARYIANAMLPENKIDFFVTLDKRTIWIHRKEIYSLFGVKVRLPSELAEFFKYIR